MSKVPLYRRPVSRPPAVFSASDDWFRGGLVCKAHSLCVSLNSRLESNKEEEGRAHMETDLF